MFKKINYIYLFLFFSFSCAQVTGINLRKHQFSLKPEKIVWIQVAGLHEEHFSWIKFDPEEKVHPFGEFLCLGKAWNYTLKDLRHDSTIGLRVQDTGQQTISGECTDFNQKPIWSYLKEKGFVSGILELGADENSSLSKVKSCKQDQYLKDSYTWISGKKLKEDKNSFHADLKQHFKQGQVYFDKSCFQGDCVSTRIQNIERLYNWIKNEDSKHLFIVKEYGFEKALKNRNFKEAKKILREINLVTESFLARSVQENILFLVTGTSSIGVEIPEQGIKLKDFLDKGLNGGYRQTMLMSPVLANGARAENFCGIYNQADILKRIFSEPTQSEKRYIFVNPFDSF